MDKPNCYECKFVRNVPGDAHKSCTNKDAKVEGNPMGIRQGYFSWPYNFDPIWLKSCTGFEKEVIYMAGRMDKDEYWYARDDRDIEIHNLKKQVLGLKKDYWMIKIQQLKEGE